MSSGDDWLDILPVFMGPYGNNGYIVSSPLAKEAVIIDAPAEPEKLLARLSGLRVRLIALTHGHQDHWLGLDALRQATGAQVALHPGDLDRVPFKPHLLLKDGDSLSVGARAMTVIHTPGHTPGSVCFLAGSDLLSGDTLFPGGPGSSKSPDALRQLIDSITRRLYVLPDGTRVHPGHGLGTTIGKSKQEYAVFASRPHPPDLFGDVTWQGS